MSNHNKIQRFIFLLFLHSILLAFTYASSSNFGYAALELYQKLHEKTLDEISKQSSEQNPHIPVGTAPTDIIVNSHTNTIYVANRIDNTVSVIDGQTNTKIGNDIQVGESPQAIGVNTETNTIYVANEEDMAPSL